MTVVGVGRLPEYEADLSHSCGVVGVRRRLLARDSLRRAIVFAADPAVFPQLKPDTAQFVGMLTSRDRIDGTLTERNITSAFGLIRIVVGDPP